MLLPLFLTFDTRHVAVDKKILEALRSTNWAAPFYLKKRVIEGRQCGNRAANIFVTERGASRDSSVQSRVREKFSSRAPLR